MRRGIAVLVAGLLFVSIVILSNGGFVGAQLSGKIRFTPIPLSMSEDGSAEVGIIVSEPIITIEEEGYLTLTLTSSDPKLTVSPSTISYTASEWTQIKTFTVAAANNNDYTSGYSGNVYATAVSNSEYYMGYVATLPVTVSNSEVAPSPSPSPSSSDLVVPSPSPTLTEADKSSPTPTPSVISTVMVTPSPPRTNSVKASSNPVARVALSPSPLLAKMDDSVGTLLVELTPSPSSPSGAVVVKGRYRSWSWLWFIGLLPIGCGLAWYGYRQRHRR